MSKYINKVTISLTKLISEISENPSLFVKNPKTDFSRNRKINFKKFIGITMNSGGGTMSKELLDYFDFDVKTPSVSAYTQQRSKVLPEAFEFLFNSFTQENMPSANSYKGYRLIACDGSNLTIATNPNDAETASKSNQFGTITNHLYLNAFYDVLNRIYLDAVLQTASEHQECRACINMMKRSSSGLKLPKTDVFDIAVSMTFTRQQTKMTKKAGYKFMPTIQTFDYLPLKSKDTYTINFRIARFAIADNSYEMLVTNLSRSEFSTNDLKEIYHLRWGIETSFRELKYSIGLTNFHARKVDYIKQEVFARLLLYNYCELITAHVVQQMQNTGKTKQVNFTIAIYICREYLRQKRNLSPPDVIKLIEKNILPVRPGRKDPRKVKPQASVSFLYRVA